MSNSREELLKLLGQEDSLELIKKQPLSSRPARCSVLLSNFEEIVNFYEANGRVPANSENIKEFQLYCRLNSIKKSPSMIKQLKEFDIYNLLAGDDVKEVSLEDILMDDPSGLIDTDTDDSLFCLNNVKRFTRISPDYVAHRKFCSDFDKYEPLFAEVHRNLEDDTRRLAIYHPNDLLPGKFFVLNGVVVYLVSVEGKENVYDYQSGQRMRFDGRTKCVFDNGTISDMLYRSLDKALQKDGYSITEPMVQKMVAESDIDENDKQNGYIYVLRSMHQRLRNVRDVYKIGSTRNTVWSRIKNARKEPTYLYADVQLVQSFRVYNSNLRQFEERIHNFLDDVRLNINIPAEDGAIISPREWFSVKLEAIEQVINLVAQNQEDQYIYDPQVGCVVAKSISYSTNKINHYMEKNAPQNVYNIQGDLVQGDKHVYPEATSVTHNHFGSSQPSAVEPDEPLSYYITDAALRHRITDIAEQQCTKPQHVKTLVFDELVKGGIRRDILLSKPFIEALITHLPKLTSPTVENLQKAFKRND